MKHLHTLNLIICMALLGGLSSAEGSGDGGATEPFEIRVIQNGFGLFSDGYNVLYLQAAESTTISVVDIFGNPIANARVKFQVVEGGGKLLNHGPRFCRDNAGDPLARVCNFNEGAVQTTEVPQTLDVKGHYGPYLCAECELGADGISCPADFAPDDQCDAVWWWTSKDGKSSVDWIMGPAPSGAAPGDHTPQRQQLEVSLPEAPWVPPLTISGDAFDVAPHETLTWLLRFPSNVNASTQPAGATLAKPFRVAVAYRHEPIARPDANPLVIVDDDLMPEDRSGGTVDVIFDVNSGVVSAKPYREEYSLEHAIIGLIDAKPTNPYDRATAFWHLSCQERDSQIMFKGRYSSGPFVNISDYYSLLTFRVIPNPDHCVPDGGIKIKLADGTETDALPMSPTPFFLEATPAPENGHTITAPQLKLTLTSHDAAMGVIDTQTVILTPVSPGIYRSGPLRAIDHAQKKKTTTPPPSRH